MFKAGEFVLYKGRICKIISVGKNGWYGTLRLRCVDTNFYVRAKVSLCYHATGLMKELF